MKLSFVYFGLPWTPFLLDDSNKIKTHTEEWNHHKTTSKDDGFQSMLNVENSELDWITYSQELNVFIHKNWMM